MHHHLADTATETSSCPSGPLLVDLNGHSHSDACGHEKVQHDDHFDYVGDDGVLHHLLEAPDCCPEHSNESHLWVSHGTVTHRKHSPRTHSASSTHSQHSHHRHTPPQSYSCQGAGCLQTCCSAGKYQQNDDPDSATKLVAASSRRALEFSSSAPAAAGLPTRLNGSSSDACTTKIYAEGICCPMEVPVIEAALGRLPGVLSIEVAVVTKTVTARHIPALASPAAMVAALNEARLEASLTFPRHAVRGKASWVPPPHVLVASVFMVISLIHYLAEPTGVHWLDYFKYVGLGAVALTLPGIALKAFGALRHYVFDIHLLITIAAAGAIAIGDYSEAATVVVLFAVADFLESRCTGQARDAISAVLALKPETAILATSGAEVDASSVNVGSLILIRAGEKVPLDGVVVSGSSLFDESVLTGESVPVSKDAGDSVRAGTLNSGSGLVTVRTTVSSEGTFIAGMARLVEEATTRQSPSEAMVAKFAKIYTPFVVLACLLLAFVPWSNPDADRKAWVYLSLQVLVTACPCALVLSTPVTVVSALARAAHAGVLIRGGVVLETLADVEVVSFDKTGTLTRGAFMINEVSLPASGAPVDERQLLRLLGSLERGSSHPLAAAVVGRAAARGVDCDATVEAFSLVPGFGIEGVVDGIAIAAGTSHYLAQRGLANDPGLLADQQRCINSGMSTCFVEINGKYAACVTARDTMRQEAEEAVSQLRLMGTTPAMLTGDNASVANAIAIDAGISPLHVHSALLPEDKLDTVAAYRRGDIPRESPLLVAGLGGEARSLWHSFLVLVRVRKKHCVRVAHVGDGVNDAPALAAADVGMAMGVAGAAAALEAGDVALFTNDLRVVPAMQRLARASGRKIAFNIVLSVVTKVIVLVLASMQRFTLWAAVLVDVGTALLVTLNGLTLLRWDFGVPGGPSLCIGEDIAIKKSSCCSSGTCCAPAPSVVAAKHHEHHHHGGGCCGSHDHHHDHHHNHAADSCKPKKACCDVSAENQTSCCDAGTGCGAGVGVGGEKRDHAHAKSGCGGDKGCGAHDHHHHHHHHHHDDKHDHGCCDHQHSHSHSHSHSHH